MRVIACTIWLVSRDIAHAFDKTRLDALLKQLNPRFFYAPAFEMYGGVDTTIMTPALVFETSGHVANFADWTAKNTLNDEVLRADLLVKNVLEARLAGDREALGVAAAPVEAGPADKKKKKRVKSTALDNYYGPELGGLMRTHTITIPSSGNPVGEPQQSIFLMRNHFRFARLLEFNDGRVLFASAQVGRSVPEQDLPRAGLLRMREFTMAKIEHYVDPLDKSRSRFGEIADIELVLLDKYVQVEGQSTRRRMTVSKAVQDGVIANKPLGYFVARISQSDLRIGIDKTRLRFRQHMASDMGHYATHCWDAEIQNRALKEPVVEERAVAEFDKTALGKMFAGVVTGAVEALDEAGLMRLRGELEQGPATITVDGKNFTIQPSMLDIERRTFETNVSEFTPNVIEPSFGIGRILYCLLEHSFWSREQDLERGVLSLPAVVAPTKVLIVPLSSQAEFDPLVKEVCTPPLPQARVHTRVDDSNTSIGKRYARNDELGTPFGVTLDFACAFRTRTTTPPRDTGQRLGSIDGGITTVTELWPEARQRRPAYDGVQAG
ncbi:hypothetical protein B0H12DRAFT_1203625 [Mycena haematopus]|nr:hypothetical protein B0H12DRAFT_1203625 [Mycena haematopus]